jgi:acetate---CoA ligase (ADP-forming)
MTAHPDQTTATVSCHYDSHVVLRDGSTLHLRPVQPGDEESLRELHERLSRDSLYFRFFSIPKDGSREVTRLLRADGNNAFVLVGESGGRISAVASYDRDAAAPDRAEVAFTIADALQGRGVGTRLLETLADIAGDHGIKTFDAYVLADNQQMMRVFLDSGFEVHRRLDGGVFHVVLSLQQTPAYEAKAAGRSRAAAVASMKAFFHPRSVAVVGANRQRGKIGAEILHNLVSGGFAGRIFPIHPAIAEIDGVHAYPRLTSVPEPIDLAVICVPADRVIPVVDACIAKHVRALVIISAGFGETDMAGRAREQTVLEKVRAAGIRLIGPNCMGIINTDPAVQLNATFSPVAPTPGRVAFLTQSGALGLAILDYVRKLNLGISTFVSVGNKADVSGNDLIQYWADDPRTDVILLYLESFGNPRRFAQIARRIAEVKPIVAVKAGRSSGGARAASSHTGALAANDVVVDALFRHAGIIRTTTLEELFDVAALLAHQPIPQGRRVGILTNAGGPGILAADACDANGLQLAQVSDGTVAELRKFLPTAGSVANPVDMLASASADDYRRATRLMLADDRIDSLLVIFIPPLITKADEVARAIVDGSEGTSKPVLANFISAQGAPASLTPVPSYVFPEAAVTALARATEYGAWRRRPKGVVPRFDTRHAPQARRIVETALRRGPGWLTPLEAQQLLHAAGVTVAATRILVTEEEASATAREIGYPVALKAVGPEILHKSDVGGVILDLADEGALRDAFRALKMRLGSTMTAAAVQQMVRGGVELLIGATFDPTFGPLIACGSGGVLVDLVHDTTFRLHPLTDVDATEMLHGLKGAALLRGYRGRPPVDQEAAIDALLRVSALLEICPEIHELDVNPLKVLEQGVCAVDVRVQVSDQPPVPLSRRVSY